MTEGTLVVVGASLAKSTLVAVGYPDVPLVGTLLIVADAVGSTVTPSPDPYVGILLDATVGFSVSSSEIVGKLVVAAVGSSSKDVEVV